MLSQQQKAVRSQSLGAGWCRVPPSLACAEFREPRNSVSVSHFVSQLVSQCVCVCVKHLHRCKTSLYVWGFTFRFCIPKKSVFSYPIECCRGAQKAHRAVPNEALYGVLRISRLITWTYLRWFFSGIARG